MLYYDRICLCNGFYPAKSNNSKECIVGYYRSFNHGFKYQDSVGHVCHYLLLCVYISDITIITLESADYHCIIYGISKSVAIILL